MDHKTTIKEALKATNTTQAQLGAQLGIRQTAISNYLSRDDMLLGTFVRILAALGYEVIIRKTGSDKEMKLTNDNS